MDDSSCPAGAPTVDRASAADLAFLAMDSGPIAEQTGVILRLADAAEVDLSEVRRLIGERIAAVPRLRQRLTAVPLGCGRPIWLDDAGFDIANHVRAIRCREPGDERALLDTAADLITSPLPRHVPLWSAVLVTELAGGETALVVVLHHALADGVGGLGLLAHLVDRTPDSDSADVAFPLPRPAIRSLAADAIRDKWRAVRRCGETVRWLRSSVTAAGGLRPSPAARCALLQPTGNRVRLDVVSVDHVVLRAAAHRHGATVNDALLVAISAALRTTLLDRGESLGSFVVAVPVSIRAADSPAFGNMVTPALVTVPAVGDIADRLHRVSRATSSLEVTAPPLIALLGPIFRRFAAWGGYRWYMRRQRRLHSLVSYLRGPADQARFSGHPITAAIPVAVGAMGNVTIFFEALSYAGTLTITAITDPDHFPAPERLAAALRDELQLVMSSAR
ncbi:WS/DGAT domain-containing protein [Mycobacterium sp. CVI_P3]|uniref:diacylglycerol O-acyltransferase n=1 Tax=Mycobacterium pinniadriaticum TaxID=2994102 RepID=A0ABT3S7S7_9MYCO|nr:wax ester/triacylglycerol synthase domain-containing protein [Mycobacterium pinniadriaticum]MCX2929124.1 WS/DGAT domain-containing protein [Mycobacterium pinniadriaticum]MCX2935549.1 WS/DGAT domain-containing protein [Mycobacterium pinniadriaticum]